MSSMFTPNNYARAVLDDTGWVDVPLTDTTNFAVYAPGELTQVRRIGDMVYIRGAIRLLTAGYIDTTTSRIFGNVPAEFRPLRSPTFACQGTSNNRWGFTVTLAGDLVAYRYGPASSTVDTWLPHYASWLAD